MNNSLQPLRRQSFCRSEQCLPTRPQGAVARLGGSAHIVRALAVMAGLLAAAVDVHAQVNSGLIAGNRTVTIPVCTGYTSPGSDPTYIHYNVGGTGYTLATSPPPQQTWPQGGDLPNLPAGQSCMNVQVTTSGMPTTTASSGRLINFRGCIVYPISGATCAGEFREYKFLYPVNPTPSLNPSGTITSNGSYPTTVTLNPPLAATRVNASCSTSNGAVVSVSPSTMTTNISGQAEFTISASALSLPSAPGNPAATCTFALPDFGNASATRQAQGSIVPTTLILSPSTLVSGGTVSVTASISPVFTGVPITATCTTSLATVQVTPATATTNASGVASFALNVSGLVNINPNTAIKPTASCLFKVQNGTGQATLNFSTGNACAFAELQPKPAACGNPT